MTPELSVVVPTHNRRDSVLRLLKALESGGIAPERFEVVVVVDGCEDDTIASLRALTTPFALTVLSQTPGRGAGSARNLGAATAKGRNLLFLDDDIEPLPGMLAGHLALHAAARSDPAIVVGAPIPVRTRDDGFHHLAVWSWWEQQFERMRLPGYRFHYTDIYSGVLSLRASVFQAVGGFDTDLPKSCRDDWELGLRLLNLRMPVVFSREAGGYHHEMRDHARLAERKEAEGRADIELARRHPQLRHHLRLAGRCPPLSSAMGVLRRLAFSAPWAGQLLVSLLRPLLGPLEWGRLRGTWHRVHGSAMYFAYWRGVAAALGGGAKARAALDTLLNSPQAVVQMTAPRVIDLDLGQGLGQAERILDRDRPDGARITLGGREVGMLWPVAGAEALRGRHLREQIAGTLSWEMGFALVMERVSSAARCGAEVAG